ncbi:hypothetical protein [Sphingomonas hankookensis]|uniref:hypothetical protein n=1 Tax=Sphingomonas hankookensis TaxID=563996 RepID=UPI003D302F06
MHAVPVRSGVPRHGRGGGAPADTAIAAAPSLALWCGNNEVSLGIAHWNWPATFDYPPALFERLVAANRDLFERLLPDLVAEHDPERFYMPSSPIGFWNDPADDARGDNHYWGCGMARNR